MFNFAPAGEVIPWGWNSLLAPPFFLTVESVHPGVNEGVNITPRGQISPLGAKFTPGGEVKNGLLASVDSCSSPSCPCAPCFISSPSRTSRLPWRTVSPRSPETASSRKREKGWRRRCVPMRVSCHVHMYVQCGTAASEGILLKEARRQLCAFREVRA
jgi:hypothetical protein